MPDAIPTDCLVCVGNDFGTLASYERLRKRRFENVPTWRHLNERLQLANVTSEKLFCTNAIIGLRTEGTALSARDWRAVPTFWSFCREFFAFQVDIAKPRLIVLLGKAVAATVGSLFTSVRAGDSDATSVTVGGHATTLLQMTHPYSDLRLTPAQKEVQATLLRTAWRTSGS